MVNQNLKDVHNHLLVQTTANQNDFTTTELHKLFVGQAMNLSQFDEAANTQIFPNVNMSKYLGARFN